jgi:hypothetical protein
MSWSLADGEALAAAHPDTFHIAPLATRAGLAPGEYAKVMIDFASGGAPVTERMWTVIVAVHSGRYDAVLVNEPAATPDDPALHYLAPITFEPRHIINWEEADDRSRAFLDDPAREG